MSRVISFTRKIPRCEGRTFVWGLRLLVVVFCLSAPAFGKEEISQVPVPVQPIRPNYLGEESGMMKLALQLYSDVTGGGDLRELLDAIRSSKVVGTTSLRSMRQDPR